MTCLVIAIFSPIQYILLIRHFYRCLIKPGARHPENMWLYPCYFFPSLISMEK
ncbi:MAG: hypothetical protein PHG20_03570 [Geobacteraceae bacterium]|nr:hypothetical protein [Geobacteraceae bacterium]